MRFRLQKGFWTSRFGLAVLGAVALLFLVAASVFTFYYIKYGREIDARLSGHILQNTTQIFSAPEHITDGQAISPGRLGDVSAARGLPARRRSQCAGGLQRFTLIRWTSGPSKLSYFAGGNALEVKFSGKTIRSIRPLAGGTDMGSGEIEPELITNLFDSSAREAATGALRGYAANVGACDFVRGRQALL